MHFPSKLCADTNPFSALRTFLVPPYSTVVLVSSPADKLPFYDMQARFKTLLAPEPVVTVGTSRDVLTAPLPLLCHVRVASLLVCDTTRGILSLAELLACSQGEILCKEEHQCSKHVLVRRLPRVQRSSGLSTTRTRTQVSEFLRTPCNASEARFYWSSSKDNGIESNGTSVPSAINFEAK